MAIPSSENATPNLGSLHPRNPHAGRYNFAALCAACPGLKRHLLPNPAGDKTIDFSDADAVLCLNQALLAYHYHLTQWKIPRGYLCPPIPGRADYIHYLADLLPAGGGGSPVGKKVNVLDIGTGANCIYPIIGSQTYGWDFVGTEIDPISARSARSLVSANPCLTNHVTILVQKDPTSIFRGIIRAGDRYDLTMCNPPFHASPELARSANRKKGKNLGGSGQKSGRPRLNFGGKNAELWCPGGELKFAKTMIEESVGFANQVGWFSCLVSKRENVIPLTKRLSRLESTQTQVIEMSQGQKRSRILAWRFLA